MFNLISAQNWESPKDPLLTKFNAHKWTFHVQGTPMCLTTHAQAPNAAHKAVVNKLEFCFVLPSTSVRKMVQNSPNILHLFLTEEGMDFNFAFNPAEKHAVTINVHLLAVLQNISSLQTRKSS